VLGPKPDVVDAWVFLLFIALVVWGAARIPVDQTVYAAGVLLFVFLTRVCTGYEKAFMGMDRYLLLAFPALISLAKLLEHRPKIALGMVCFLAWALFIYSMRFAQWYWVG